MSKLAGLWRANAGAQLGVLAVAAALTGGILYLAGVFDRSDDVTTAAPEAVEVAPSGVASQTTPEPAVSNDVATTKPELAASEPETTTGETAAEPKAESAEPEEPKTVAEPKPAAPETATSKASDDAPEVADVAEPAAPVADLPPPAFDLVRVEPDGTTLVAGAAAPDTEIVILMDGAELSRATSDATGAFVSFLSLPHSVTPRVLSLVARHADGDVPSEEEVILAPTPVAVANAPQSANQPEDQGTKETVDAARGPEGESETAELRPEIKEESTPEPAVAQEQDQSAPEVAETTSVPSKEENLATKPQEGTPELAAVEPQASTPEGVQSTAPEAVTAPKPVTILRADADGVEVLQSGAADTAPEAMTSVALDAISYSEIGDVSLSGRAPDQGNVRVYLDNAPVATLEVDDSGRWRGDLPKVETGVYTLRIDQVDASGAVTSRVETPFKREEPDVLAAALAKEANNAAPVRAVTVQTGATLWAIARERYGDGMLFVRVFDANRDSIRDPDLIYPGQVFALPD
ncbi:MAG: LysM peptidoglycan-binding domain-containing protein [Paracoccaceae bacterium]